MWANAPRHHESHDQRWYRKPRQVRSSPACIGRALPEAGLSIGLWFLFGCHRLFGRGLYRGLIWPVAWYSLHRDQYPQRLDRISARVGALAPEAGHLAAWRAAARHVRSLADALIDKTLVWTGRFKLVDTRIEWIAFRRRG